LVGPGGRCPATNINDLGRTVVMTQILRDQGPRAALAAIQALIGALVPPWERPAVDPWSDGVTLMFGAVPAWLA
jgi:hypothetical protein